MCKRKPKWRPLPNSSLCSCKHFCVSSSLVARDFQGRFINSFQSTGIPELLRLMKTTGCACDVGNGGPGETGALLEILPIPTPATCTGRLNPRANVDTALQLCPTPCDLTKVEGFVCLPPPNYPLGEKMRRKYRLITESFPPQLHWELGLPNPCRTPATEDKEEARWAEAWHRATEPR